MYGPEMGAQPQVAKGDSAKVNVFEAVAELRDLERNYGIVLAQLKALEANDETGRAMRTRMKMETAMGNLARSFGDPQKEESKTIEWLEALGDDVGNVTLAARAHIQLEKKRCVKNLQEMIDLGMRRGPQALIEEAEDQGGFEPPIFDAAALKRFVRGE